MNRRQQADPTEASDASSTDSSPAKEELAKWQAYLGTVRKALSTFKNDDLVVDFATWMMVALAQI